MGFNLAVRYRGAKDADDQVDKALAKAYQSGLVITCRKFGEKAIATLSIEEYSALKADDWLSSLGSLDGPQL